MKRKQKRKQRSTPTLPYDVLLHIYQYLPPQEIRNVRRVCRGWHEAGTRRAIAEREKFIFPADARPKEVTQFIMRSRYPVLNLEFQGRPINIIANVWKECGERIYELVFHKCTVSDQTMRSVILYCENLTTFDVQTSTGPREELLYSLPLLNDLIKKGIRHPKLCTLSMCVKEEEHQEIIRGIWHVHPSVRNLKISKAPYSDPFTLRLGECLSPDTPLESLTYNAFTDEHWIETLIDKAEEGFRLKHLETTLNYQTRNENTILRFFRSQRNLEVIRLRVLNAQLNGFKDFILAILEICSKLREFHVENEGRPYCIRLLASDTPRFVNAVSNLQCLSLSFDLGRGEAAYKFYIQLKNTIFAKLTSLKWDNAADNSCFVASFLRRCTSLHHLQLTRCCDSTLQTIFKYLTELRTLRIDADECTEAGFIGSVVQGPGDDSWTWRKRDLATWGEIYSFYNVGVNWDGEDKEGSPDHGYSIKSLQKLKSLRLHDDGSRVKMRTALELQLPNLEYIILNDEF